jgi:MFS family permease
MFKNAYFKTALGIYISYCMLGMIIILLASHMTFLTKQLQTDAAGISFLISMEGLVRSVTIYIIGRLSDKFGRKKFLCLAPIIMAVFLIGIPFSQNYKFAMIFSAFAGVAHAIMDATSYPSLVECFPENPGTATVIIKAFVSLGASILPFIIAFFIGRDMFYGYTFFVIALIMVLNGLFLIYSKFPDIKEINENNNDTELCKKKFREEPIFKKEGIALIIIGFTSNAVYMAFQTWTPTYAQQILGMDQISSLKFISYYSIGAIFSVFILAKLLQKTIKPVLVTLVYPIIGLFALLLILFVRIPTVATIGFFLIGVSTAGVLQMAQTTMGELFWKNKGATMALVSTASGLAAAIIPGFMGLIVRYYGVLNAFYFLIIIYIIGIMAASFAKLRYDRVNY